MTQTTIVKYLNGLYTYTSEGGKVCTENWPVYCTRSSCLQDERCHCRCAGDGDADSAAGHQHQSPAGQVGGK